MRVRQGFPSHSKDDMISGSRLKGSGTGPETEGDRGMAKEVLFLVEDALEGGYTARALGYSIFTEADSWEDLKSAIRDAVQCHFDEGDLPDPIRLHAVREEVVPA
jgi:hypothetical protein